MTAVDRRQMLRHPELKSSNNLRTTKRFTPGGPELPQSLILDKRTIKTRGVSHREEEFTMGKKIYVGNLSYNTYENSLRDIFSAYGQVDSVKIITDRDSGQSKGFCFVEMGSDAEAQAAIQGINGREVDGRQLKVNEAMDKPRRDNNRY